MCAKDVQDVYDGVNSAGRPSPRNYIPADTDVVSSHDGSELTTHENHGPHLTRAERKIDAVYGPENAPSCPSLPEIARKAYIRAQPSIDRLPNELLCEIFLLTGDRCPASYFPRDPGIHDNDIKPPSVHFYSMAAVLLGRVCVRWMRVTRGFPALWTTVDVLFPTRAATAILKRFLKYSAGLPLALWISKSLRPEGGCEGLDDRFMRLAAANAHRWAEISIELCDQRDILRPLAELPPGSFSALERARVDFSMFRAGPDTPDTLLWKSFLSSPHLVAVDFARAEYIRTGILLAPLQQLTELGLQFAEPEIIPLIFRTCFALEVLCIDIYVSPISSDRSETTLIETPVCLPRLRALTLCGPHDWTQIFNCLTVPALKRLCLSHTEIWHAEIESMLRRSAARIIMLSIHWPATNQADKILGLLHSEVMRHLRVVRYQCAYPGESRMGWEDTFDLQPFVPSHVVYTTWFADTEGAYARVCSW
ncbi:hypothetical protein K525DRAFT_254574 [Schizophyllum commune Loenen D]|nr:hypothetical protein K525DRAFT_254574 [Schizophyllum commune Loenen D]